MRRRWVSTAIATVGLALVSACGVPLQSTAERLPPNVLPAPLSVPSPSPVTTSGATSGATATAAPTPTAAVLRLWFVKEDGLAAAPSDLIEGASPDLVVQALAIGPSPEQVDQGLRTVARDPLTGLALVTIDPVVDASAEATAEATAPPASGPPTTKAATSAPVAVRLGAAFSALPPAEQVLLLGQVVLSLTGAGVSTVAFTDEAGTPVAVPLPDGRLLDLPATTRDYASLIVRP